MLDWFNFNGYVMSFSVPSRHSFPVIFSFSSLRGPPGVAAGFVIRRKWGLGFHIIRTDVASVLHFFPFVRAPGLILLDGVIFFVSHCGTGDMITAGVGI